MQIFQSRARARPDLHRPPIRTANLPRPPISTTNLEHPFRAPAHLHLPIVDYPPRISELMMATPLNYCSTISAKTSGYDSPRSIDPTSPAPSRAARTDSRPPRQSQSRHSLATGSEFSTDRSIFESHAFDPSKIASERGIAPLHRLTYSERFGLGSQH
jgi:hypothetical protein